MGHKTDCNDKSELFIDLDSGKDRCMDCGEIIKDSEDQFLIQEAFLAKNQNEFIKEQTKIVRRKFLILRKNLESCKLTYQPSKNNTLPKKNLSKLIEIERMESYLRVSLRQIRILKELVLWKPQKKETYQAIKNEIGL